jgi:hypothetical protein
MTSRFNAGEDTGSFTDSARAALLWVLWHHQGGHSPVGQALRFALDMGTHDRLTEAQVTAARRWGQLQGYRPGCIPCAGEHVHDKCGTRGCVKLREARELLEFGIDVVNRGAEIMTTDQLGRWEGCRAFVEMAADQCS